MLAHIAYFFKFYCTVNTQLVKFYEDNYYLWG